MKKKYNSKKKIISFILILAMGCGSMNIPGWGINEVYADEGTVSANVNLSFQSGGYIVPKQLAAVSSALAETYGYDDSVSSTSAVSALDVLVKVHEISMGIEGTPDQDDKDTIHGMLDVNSSGFIKLVMGVDTSNFGFTVNGEVPNDGTIGAFGYNGYTVNQAVVATNDNVEFFIYQDSYALDNYSWFEQGGKKVEQITVLPDSDIQLALKGYCIGWYGLTTNSAIHTSAISDAQIVTVATGTGITANWNGKITDEDDGTVTLSFSTPGAYVISAKADPDDSPLIMPWMDVTVLDPKDNIPSDIPENDVSTYVTITDSQATYVTKQALDIGWFDIRPFMTAGTESYALSKDILTANALIEAVYFNLFGRDPSREDLDIGANSTTAQAIKAKLNINVGKWGLSTDSIFGNDKLVMSTINDSFGDYGIGGDTVKTGDSIVFYSYDKEYSYFDVLKIETGSVNYGTLYPVVHVKLKVSERTYPSAVAPIEGAQIYLNGDKSYCYGTTSSNGIVDAQFMRYGSPSEELVISAEAEGVIRPYLKIAYTWNGTQAVITKVSQPVLTDTSLSTFKVNAYGTAMDASNYSGNQLAYDVDSSVESITLSAITTDSSATASSITASGLTTKTASFPNATGGSVSVPLDLGLNTISFNVLNGDDSETYNLTVRRNAGVSDVIGDVNRVINGITGYTSYADSVYDYNWIVGKIGAGKAVSAAEKNAFLTQIVNGAASMNVGSKAKAAIALTALNIDATKIPVINSDETLNLPAQVYNDSEDTIPFISYLPYMLMMEDLGNYSIPSNAKWGREKLIQYALDHYAGYSGWNTGNGVDYAAMMIPALAPYYKHANDNNGYNGISQASCAAIKVKVDEVVAQFKSLQEANGSFGNNSDSTAVVVAALASLGIDPDGADFTKQASGKSALKAIFAYETTDNRLGYTSKKYSEFASMDGIQALASYLKYYAGGEKNGDGCIYRFTKEITPYTNWPNADLLTGIKVTKPTNTIYEYDALKTSDTADTTGMTVTAVYNGDASKTANIPVASCTVSKINRASSGTQTVTVSYQGYTANFMITVSKNGEPVVQDTVRITVKGTNKTIASQNSVVIESGKTTVMDVLKSVLDDAGVSYLIKNSIYVSEIDGLGEFNKGPNSGWLYSVNGTTPPTTAASEYILKSGDSVYWYYTLDYTKDSSTSNWNKSTAAVNENAAAGTGKIEVTSKVDASGRATAVISASDISAAVSDAVKSAESAGAGTKKEVQITVGGAGSASSVETTIPNASIKEFKAKVDAVTVKTPVADISLDASTLATLSAESAGDIKITAAKLSPSDLSSLSDAAKAEIGNKPVFDFSITSGSKTISEFSGKVTVTVPYTPSEQELAGGLVVYYINDSGKLEMVRDCVYDAKTKTMTFVTSHFSKYTIGYKKLDFSDVSNHWAKDYITYLSARDIIKGMSQTTFAPNSNITRAQFVQILANLAGADLSRYTGEKLSAFSDVKESSWYAKVAAWAAESGISTGVENKDGSKSFHPNENISRQDMAVMILRYTEKMGTYSLTAVNKAASFEDGNQIAAYAKESVSKLQQAGLLSGKTSITLAPKDNATRAESAKMITMLIENSL